MDSDDDETIFSPPSSSPSPLRRTSLKRLRRASRFPDEPALVSPPLRVPTPPIEEPLCLVDQVPSVSRSGGGGLVEAVEEVDDDGLDPLFGERGQFTGCDAPDLELGVSGECDLSEERDGTGYGTVGLDKGEFDGVEKVKKSAKKRLDLDWGEEENVAKKKKMDGGGDGKPVESIRNKRKLEKELLFPTLSDQPSRKVTSRKERTALLEQLHAESQKLLRETRDASFKHAPFAKKPISSVLEKIRLKKLEMLKKFTSSNNMDSPCDANESLSNDPFHPHASEVPDVVRSSEAVTTDTRQTPKSLPGCSESINNDGRQDTDSGQEHQEPAFIVQEDSIFDSPVVEEEIIQSEKQLEGYIENIVFTSNGASTELDPDDLYDTSSEEEAYDKENMDPLKDKYVPNLYNEAVLKTFVDDEAEEEDDSDHDLMRFEDNEDDDESEESEELNDMIATGFKEKPVDQERRNLLHQKWLEQQDAAETDNVLQRINNCVRHREPTSHQDDEDIAENSGEDSQDGALPANVVCGNSKAAKNAIMQMFNDVDDDFVSSDDEETERRLSRQRLLEHAGVGSSVLPPEADENSREFFSLIKKLNIAPDPKKRTMTATQSYDVILKAENSNSSSRSSFLGRATSNSVPPSCKKGSRIFKSYVFARDDSNSRDGTSALDNPPTMGSEEIQPTRTASAKYSVSQTKSVGSEVKSGDDSSTSKSSLFEILRRSSLHSDQQNDSHQSSGTRMSESQAARQLSAFKLRNRVPKK